MADKIAEVFDNAASKLEKEMGQKVASLFFPKLNPESPLPTESLISNNNGTVLIDVSNASVFIDPNLTNDEQKKWFSVLSSKKSRVSGNLKVYKMRDEENDDSEDAESRRYKHDVTHYKGDESDLSIRNYKGEQVDEKSSARSQDAESRTGVKVMEPKATGLPEIDANINTPRFTKFNSSHEKADTGNIMFFGQREGESTVGYAARAMESMLEEKERLFVDPKLGIATDEGTRKFLDLNNPVLISSDMIIIYRPKSKTTVVLRRDNKKEDSWVRRSFLGKPSGTEIDKFIS